MITRLHFNFIKCLGSILNHKYRARVINGSRNRGGTLLTEPAFWIA